MKLRKLIFIAFLSVSILSCTSDNSSSNNGGSDFDKRANLRSLGESANELLSDEKFTSINIEMLFVPGYEPSQKTIDNLKIFLSARTFKPDGISISTRAVASSGKAPFNIDEIAEIEVKERLLYNAGDEITVYIYFADGSNDKDSDTKVVLGSSYRNTSMVIYGKTIKNVAERVNAPDKGTVESTVVNHEFGHLFGLVGVGTPMLTDHKDDSSEAHCNVDGCLMAANVSFGSGIIDIIDNNNIPQLDELCLRDLQANGGR